MKKYPKEFYRGIANNPDNFDPNGYLTKAAFQFKSNPKRTDGYDEMSINWNDSIKSLKLLLSLWNHRKNCFLASYGYVCFPLSFLNAAFPMMLNNKVLSYERRRIIGCFFRRIKSNKYHGNILFSNKKSDKRDKVAFQEAMVNYSNEHLFTRESFFSQK